MGISRHYVLAVCLALVAAGLPLAPPHRAAAFDYVTNGGFESGTNGWTAGTQSQFDVARSPDVPPVDGANAARITSSGSSITAIRQTSWSGAPAGRYHVSAWVRITASHTTAVMNITEDPSIDGRQFSSTGPPDHWLQLGGDVDITGSNSLTIVIGGTGAASGEVIYVDDVQLEGQQSATLTPTNTPVPPPSGTAAPSEAGTRTPTATKTVAPTRTPDLTNTPIAAAAIGRNLPNAGFENASDDGAVDVWRKYGGTLESVAAPAHSGEHAARLTSSTDSTKWLYQTVLVDGGSNYAFSAWVRDDDPGVAAAFLRVAWYASEDGSGSAIATVDSSERLTTPSPDYRHLATRSITAPDGARSARVRIAMSPRSAAVTAIYADDAAFGPSDLEGPPAAAPASASVADDTNSVVPAVHRVLGDVAAPNSTHVGSNQIINANTSAGPSQQRILINEVMYAPDGPAAGDAGEWVELYNAGDDPVDLQNWTLADAVNSNLLGATSVEPHEFAIVAASDSFRTRYPEFKGTLLVLNGRIGNGLGNNGDRLLLRDPAGNVADAISWGSDASVMKPAIPNVPTGHSIERRLPDVDTDAASDFVDNMRPSPGAPFAAAGGRAAPSQSTGAPQALASRHERSFGWLPWSVAGIAAMGLAVVLSWRAVPMLTQRLRQHS